MDDSLEGLSEHDAFEGVPTPAAAPRLHGHEKALEALVEAHAGGRMHHAWLLQGPRGIGKATLAFAFASRLLSTAGDAELATVADPAVRRQIAAGSQPNLLHITRPAAERGGGFKTQIPVEEIRRLNRFFQTTPSGRQWRIVVIDPVDDMNRSAANALLKILEEPPQRSLFLVTNHMPGRLLPTIRSRCRVLRLEPLPAETVGHVLEALDLPSTQQEREAAAMRAEGSVRDAVALLSSGGLEIERRLEALVAVEGPEWHGIQSLADELSQRGREGAFDLAVASLFRHLALASEAALRKGRPGQARALARLWVEESARIRDGLAFNLDRKQMLMTFFAKRFALGRNAGMD